MPAATTTTRRALLSALLGSLKALEYRFVAVTPATHERVLARPAPVEPSLRDVFGWNRPFDRPSLAPELFDMLEAAGALERCGTGWRSLVRVASLGDDLFLHSSFPTEDKDAVFFGPDTYRFATFIARTIGRSPGSVVDLGAGSGAGGIVAARLSGASEVTLVDINSAALELAESNAVAAGIEVKLQLGSSVPAATDVVLANPPYMIDDAARAYRDGGGLYGGELALEWAREALCKLAPGGRVLLYTGAAVVGGETPLLDALGKACTEVGARWTCEEIDPDVFGEELVRPAYRTVERIAAIGAVLQLP